MDRAEGALLVAEKALTEARKALDAITELRLQQGPQGRAGDPGSDGKDGDRGPDGAPGKFHGLKQWVRGIHYEAQLVTHEGSTYCAKLDTAESPPHDDWHLVAAKGTDAPVGKVCGLHDPGVKYQKFDLVVFNGAEWRAKKDDPGSLPGEGWALCSKQGERGKIGPRGERGEPGRDGKQGPSIIEWVREGYCAIPIMSDGSAGPALDVRQFFQLYHGETR